MQYKLSTMMEVVALLMLAVYLGAQVWNSLGSAKPTKYRNECHANLKRIGVAIDEYVRTTGDIPRDDQGRFSLLKLADSNGAANTPQVKCPGNDGRWDKDLFVNPNINSASQLKTGNNRPIPIVMDLPENHARIFNVLMSNGSVCCFRPEDWNDLSNGKWPDWVTESSR